MKSFVVLIIILKGMLRMKIEELKERIRGSHIWVRGDMLEFMCRVEKNPPDEFIIKNGRITAKGDQTCLIEHWMWGDQRINNVRMIPTGTNLVKVILIGLMMGIPIEISNEMEYVINDNINGLHGVLGFREVFSIIISDVEITVRTLSFFTQHPISLMKDRKLMSNDRQLVKAAFELALENKYSDVAQAVVENFHNEITSEDLDKMIEQSVDADMTELTMSLLRIKHDNCETSNNVMRL
jgi:hypothetical protein